MAVTTAFERSRRRPLGPLDLDLPRRRVLVPGQRAHLRVEDDVVAELVGVGDPVEVALVLGPVAERVEYGKWAPKMWV